MEFDSRGFRGKWNDVLIDAAAVLVADNLETIAEELGHRVAWNYLVDVERVNRDIAKDEYPAVFSGFFERAIQVKKTTGFYPSIRVDAAPVAATGSAGGVLLTRAAEVTGLTAALRDGLQPWRKPTAVHHPGKVVTDLAVTLALGGDCLADAGLIRSEPDLYGRAARTARGRPLRAWIPGPLPRTFRPCIG